MITSSLYQDLFALLREGLQALPDKPDESPEGTLHALWHTAAGTPLSARRAVETTLPALHNGAAERLRELVAKRLTGFPLAYLTGLQEFMGLDLPVGPGALIPRKETELLGRAALDLLQQVVRQTGAATVIDVCTGSGNLALALASHEPRARVFAADLSAEAVQLARSNVAHLGLQGRVEIREGDLLQPFDVPEFHGQVDLLTCNPPYISSRKVDTMPGEIIHHEPRLAFDGGPFGIRILQRLVRTAPRFLRSGGWLAFEVGAGQGPGMLQRLKADRSFVEVRAVSDASGEIRAILACIA